MNINKIAISFTCALVCTQNLNAAAQSPKREKSLLTLSQTTPLHHKGVLTEPAKNILKRFGADITTLAEANKFAQENLLPTGERWRNQANPLLPVMEKNREFLLKQFAILGMVNGLSPDKKEYDFALILSDIRPNAIERFEYFAALIKAGYRFNRVALLSGGQPLEPEETVGLPSKIITQTQMMKYQYKQLKLPTHARKLPLYVVDSPMIQQPDGSMKRPNTDSTFQDFIKKDPVPGSCLVITNQPFVPRQTEVGEFYLDQEAHSITGAGPAAKPTESIMTYCGEFARRLYMAKKLFEKQQLETDTKLP